MPALKKTTIYYYSLLLFLLSTGLVSAQTSSVCEKAFMITQTANRHHYYPRAIDDRFSELVFDRFFDLLDPKGTIFTLEDIQSFEKYKQRLDDDIKQKKCDFVNEVTLLYQAKIASIDSLINSYKTKEINYLENDSLVESTTKVYLSQKEWLLKWQPIIKYHTLKAYFSKNDKADTTLTYNAKELAEIQAKVIENQSCKIKSKTANADEVTAVVESKYLNAVCFAFDPHSNYFSINTKQHFVNLLSKEEMTFGFEIFINDVEEIEIYSLLPGGAAWKSNLLNVGDIVLEVKTKNESLSDFNCLSMQEVFSMVYAASTHQLTLLVRKKSGEEVLVELEKTKVDVEANNLESFILEGDTKIGYIYLPSFYTETDQRMPIPNGCANDVSTALAKLKRENISGLIIDLRNNGGGALLEAIRLSGVFIDYGALAILDKKNNTPVTLKDINRGMSYEGPLLILVNSFSASASEMFAAAMQDHNRAIIVGSSTYGKASSQQIIPLDAYKYDLPVNANSNSEDYLKLTTGKFYRVTGNSHQNEGVQPDIHLPQAYEENLVGEVLYPSALEKTTIYKKTYYTPFDSLPVGDLKRLSNERVNNNETFAKIKEEQNEQANTYSIQLSFDMFYDYYKENRTHNADTVNNELFKVNNPGFIKGMSSFSNKDEEINQEIMTEIQNDVYIQESYQIINDLITLKNN